MMQQQPDWTEPESRSVVQLLSDVSRELQDILRKEVELARLEISVGISSLGSMVSSFAAGGVVLHAGFLVVLAAAVLALDKMIGELWLSALVVGVLTMGIGAILAVEAKSRLGGKTLQPTRTQESLRKDKELITEHL
jgi:hypothetical protein